MAHTIVRKTEVLPPDWVHGPMPQPTTGLSNRLNLKDLMSAKALSEAVLIQRCIAGDACAWDRLFRQYRKTIYRFAHSLCRNHEQAEDISGRVMMLLYQNLHTFRGEALFSSWLFHIIRNAYHDACRQSMHSRHLSLDTGPVNQAGSSRAWDLPDPAPSPETLSMERNLEKERAQILVNAIHHLPAYQRQVIRMYHVEEKSYEEIAKEIGHTIGTVKSRLNRARAMLRERLVPFQETFMTD